MATRTLNDTVCYFRLPEDLKDRMDSAAAAAEIPTAGWLRQAIREKLQRERKGGRRAR